MYANGGMSLEKIFIFVWAILMLSKNEQKYQVGSCRYMAAGINPSRVGLFVAEQTLVTNESF